MLKSQNRWVPKQKEEIKARILRGVVGLFTSHEMPLAVPSDDDLHFLGLEQPRGAGVRGPRTRHLGRNPPTTQVAGSTVRRVWLATATAGLHLCSTDESSPPAGGVATGPRREGHDAAAPERSRRIRCETASSDGGSGHDDTSGRSPL